MTNVHEGHGYVRPHHTKQLTRGFTIVELLIVVVVIAILAAITIVAYNGIQQRAKSSALQSEMSQLQRTIQVELLQSGLDGVSVAAPLAYMTEPGVSPLAMSIENGFALTMYAVFDTNGDQSAAWHTIAQMLPRAGTTHKFELRSNSAASNAVNGSSSTSAESDRSVTQSNIRNTTGRHIGWQAASTSIVEAGFDKSVLHGSWVPVAHSGWNFSELYLAQPVGMSGVAALVFPEYHDQATRQAIMRWLDSKYAIDYFSE